MSDGPRDRLEERALRAWADLGRELSADTSLDRLVRRSSPGDPSAPTPIDAQLALLNTLTGALHAYGLPAHRVEEAIARVTTALGLRVQLVSQLTSFTFTIEHEGQQRTQVVRVQPGRSDLEKLSALHELVGRIERQELTVAEAARRITVITESARRYGPLATTLCHGLSSASAAALLGATSSEALWAAPVGVLVGAAVTLAEPLRALQQLLPAASTLLAAVASFSLAHQGVPVRPLLLTLAGVVVLLPGLATTMGIMELATGNLVSSCSWCSASRSGSAWIRTSSATRSRRARSMRCPGRSRSSRRAAPRSRSRCSCVRGRATCRSCSRAVTSRPGERGRARNSSARRSAASSAPSCSAC
jgi:uncharacterized membrane protein YjjP (DUF1212 family)